MSLSGWGLFEGEAATRACRSPAGPSMATHRGICRSRQVPGDHAHPAPRRTGFDWRDAQPETPSAVIVNESFARRYFPGESPLGKRFYRIDAGAALVAQDIVGVAADAKYTDIQEAAPRPFTTRIGRRMPQ